MSRKIDALVAEKILEQEPRMVSSLSVSHPVKKGEFIIDDDTGVVFISDGSTCVEKEFAPSTSIADAWLVVEKMQNDGYRWDIASRARMSSDFKIRPYVAFWCYAAGKISVDVGEDADTAPLAICLAALKAVGVKVA